MEIKYDGVCYSGVSYSDFSSLSGISTVIVNSGDCYIDNSSWSTYSYRDTHIRKDGIKDYLKNNPEILNQLLLELREEKINKLI